MRRMSHVGRFFAGGGLIAGGFAALSLMTKATLAVETVKELKDALQIYATYVRTPVLGLLGFDSPQLATYAVDLLILWIALFLAVNAFVQRCDGLFVWGHIGTAYCYRAKPKFMARFSCTLPKFVWAFIATPIVCVRAIWSSAMTGQPAITMAYMTVEPKAVARYLVIMFGLPGLIIVLSRSLA